MNYELIYTQNEQNQESLIGAQIDKVFVPKLADENEERFLSRLEALSQSDTGRAN